jgi:hypothetical protein
MDSFSQELQNGVTSEKWIRRTIAVKGAISIVEKIVSYVIHI